MDETLGVIIFIGLFVLFGLPLALALFLAVIFYALESVVKILTHLGYAAIVPAGLYAFLDYMKNRKGKNGRAISPGTSVIPIGNRHDPS